MRSPDCHTPDPPVVASLTTPESTPEQKHVAHGLQLHVSVVLTGMGTVRRHTFIDASADAVWSLVGDPARLHEWFPIVSCEVQGNKRWINLAGGLRFEEDIVTLDHDLRRFQYSIVNNPIIKRHLGTVDVIPDGSDRCVVVYSTDLDPEVMALIIAGGAGAGLAELHNIFPDRVHPDHKDVH